MRRLGDQQPGGGPAEVQFLGHRDEVLEFTSLEFGHASRLSAQAQRVLDARPWRGFHEGMIIHTLIYSFPDTMTDQDREQFFRELETMMLGEGGATKFTYRSHLPLPNDAHAPVFAATDIAQLGFDSLHAIEEASALPALREFMVRWQARFPYNVVWANHEPLL
jgi:hypothetical protein